MNITLINGSPSKNSKTFALLRYLESLLKEKGITTTMWNLREHPLPIVMPQYHKNPLESPDNSVKEFVRLIENSQGIILGTPLYHGSYSGVLKNALDNLSYDAFRNKVVGIVSSAGGMRSTQACEHLSSVVRTLYGYTTQTVIGTEYDDYENIDNSYVLINDEIKQRCLRFINELVQICKLHSTYELITTD